MLNKKELIAACLYAGVIVIGITAIAGFYKNNRNVLPIIEHPDPVLRIVAEPVDRIDDAIISLTEDIISTLHYHDTG